MLALLRHALAMLRNVKLLALHLIGNAALLVAASFWLLIPEAHIWQLLFACLSALLIIIVSLWLHSGTLVYAVHPKKENLHDSFVLKIERMFWLLLGVFLLLWGMNVVNGWIDSRWQIADYIYSKAPTWLHPTSGSDGYTRILDYCLSTFYWYVLPSILLPIVAARSVGAGFLRGIRVLRHWQYWLGTAVAVLLGVWATKLLIGWMPGTTLTQQTLSMVTRMAFAYLIATVAWLLTAGVVGYFLSSDDAVVDSWAPVLDRIAPAGGETRAIVHRSITVVRDRRLVILQLATGFVAALLALWNPGGSTEVSTLVIGISVGFLVLIGFLWIYSGTLVYAADPVDTEFANAFRFRFRRILWLLAGLIVLVVLQEGFESLLWKLNSNDRHFGLISNINECTSDYIMPCLVLPWTAVKVVGQPFRDGLRILRSWRYWLGMMVIVYLSEWISNQLTFMTFAATSFWAGSASVLLHMLSSLPFVVAWVAAAGLVGYYLSHRTGNIIGQPVS